MSEIVYVRLDIRKRIFDIVSIVIKYFPSEGELTSDDSKP